MGFMFLFGPAAMKPGPSPMGHFITAQIDMPIFKCEKCGCAENTALGWYWAAKALAEDADWTDVGEQYKGKHLCSECAPTHYKDGTETGFTHEWHGKFPKEPYEDGC